MLNATGTIGVIAGYGALIPLGHPFVPKRGLLAQNVGSGLQSKSKRLRSASVALMGNRTNKRSIRYAELAHHIRNQRRAASDVARRGFAQHLVDFLRRQAMAGPDRAHVSGGKLFTGLDVGHDIERTPQRAL